MSETPGPPGQLIRVAFLEDDRGVAEVTMEGLASRGIEVVGLVATIEAAVVLAAAERPDLFVADIDLAGRKALGLPDALGPAGPPVLWWSGHGGRYRVAAHCAGGAGFVSKRDGFAELVAGIRAVADGRQTWTLADLRAKALAPARPTAREREVLAGVAAGHPNKEVGLDLGITERAVESHLRRMYDRYAVSNRTELCDIADLWCWI